MPIPITCSGCSATMSAPDHFVGKRVSCPRCKTSFVIPDPKAAAAFEVIEDEPIPVAEVLDDDPPPVPVAKPATKAVPVGTASAGKTKKPNPRYKKQVDPSDYRTRINGKPLALKPGEAMPPTSLPRKSPPRI